MKVEAKRFTLRWWTRLPWIVGDVYRRLTPPDPAVETMSYWWHGSLPRQPVEQVFGNASNDGFQILNPGRRDHNTSVTLFELSCILMAVRSVKARRVLEIGTFDGNTTLNLASNLPPGGEVTTIDLPIEAPPEFELELEQPRERNITDRSVLGEQFKGRQCPANYPSGPRRLRQARFLHARQGLRSGVHRRLPRLQLRQERYREGAVRHASGWHHPVARLRDDGERLPGRRRVPGPLHLALRARRDADRRGGRAAERGKRRVARRGEAPPGSSRISPLMPSAICS